MIGRRDACPGWAFGSLPRQLRVIWLKCCILRGASAPRGLTRNKTFRMAKFAKIGRCSANNGRRQGPGALSVSETAIALPQVANGLDLVKFKNQARQFLKAHVGHLALQRWRRGQALTPTDLVALERLLADAGGTPDLIQKAAEDKLGLGIFIRPLVGGLSQRSSTSARKGRRGCFWRSRLTGLGRCWTRSGSGRWCGAAGLRAVAPGSPPSSLLSRAARAQPRSRPP